MEISYDRKHNVAYLGLRPRVGEIETLSLSDSVNVDVGPDGTLFGIELLNADEQLQDGPEGLKVIFNDPTTGLTTEARMPAIVEPG